MMSAKGKWRSDDTAPGAGPRRSPWLSTTRLRRLYDADNMESDLTWVAPEGVYSLSEEHKPTGHIINANANMFPTKLSTALVRFPAAKSSAGFGALLGATKKDKDKDKEKPKADDAQSVSSEGTDGSPPGGDLSSNPPADSGDPPSLFSQPPPGARKKSASRPKHNMRTTSSTFITRLHTAEGLTRTLQAKTGDVSFLFYNSAKSFFWTEAGIKLKVCTALTADSTN
jgi:hypothetical protein